MNQSNNEIQNVSWSMYIPKLGEKVLIGLQDFRFRGTFFVIDKKKNRDDIVSSIVVQSKLGECYTLGILNGEWKIIDPMENRTIIFPKENIN